MSANTTAWLKIFFTFASLPPSSFRFESQLSKASSVRSWLGRLVHIDFSRFHEFIYYLCEIRLPKLTTWAFFVTYAAWRTWCYKERRCLSVQEEWSRGCFPSISRSHCKVMYGVYGYDECDGSWDLLLWTFRLIGPETGCRKISYNIIVATSNGSLRYSNRCR